MLPVPEADRAAALRGRRVLVTGAGGFIGSHLRRSLERAGVTYAATCRPGAPQEGRPGWLTVDFANAAAVRDAVFMVRPQVVFHLAAQLGAARTPSVAHEMIVVNVLGTHALLAALHEAGADVQRVILTGSGEEYGRSDVVPVTEEQPAQPVSPYSASKASATQFALLYHELFDLPVVVLRPFVVYGPGQSREMMIPSLIRAALTGADFPMTAGEQTRDFIYVDDVVEALLAAAVIEGAAGAVINVCSGEERRIRDVAQLAHALCGGAGVLKVGALPYRANEIWRLVGSNARARRLLGWSAAVPLEEGLRRTVHACRTEQSQELS